MGAELGPGLTGGREKPICQEVKEQTFTCRLSTLHPQNERGQIWAPFSGLEENQPGQGGEKRRQDPVCQLKTQQGSCVNCCCPL